MSTHYGFRCQTCDVNSPTWLNHGADMLAKLYANRQALIMAQAAIRDADLWIVSMSYASSIGDEPFPIDFLAAHEWHDVVLRNEYGDIQTMAYPAMPSLSDRARTFLELCKAAGV